MPPHAINHRANLAAFCDLDVAAVISINSVGSLDPGLVPGTLVSCDDYVSFFPATFQDDLLRPVTPSIANALIPEIAAALPFGVTAGKVYVQTRGPRFETPAEIRIIRNWGDVVGMTLAAEADLCGEAGLDFNSLAMVDNLANGLEGQRLSPAQFQQQVKLNQSRIETVLSAILELYA